MIQLTSALTGRYLHRLGVDRPPQPTIEALNLLHRRHVELVAYENLDIQLGLPTTVHPVESATRIAGGRGGYCFHLNGAFSALLASLGYQVTIHRGQVKKSNRPATGVDFPNHLALTVNVDGRHWFIDVGLGDALHSPVPLEPSSFRQGPFMFKLLPTVNGWRFEHDVDGSFNVMDWENSAAEAEDFALSHKELSTASESTFVRNLVVMRRCACQIDTLVGRLLTHRGDRTVVNKRLNTQSDLATTLQEVFHLSPLNVSPDQLSALWQRTRPGGQP
jgi:arylamine N-acetyltransferase